MLILPINSVINPFLYDNFLTAFLSKMLRLLFTPGFWILSTEVGQIFSSILEVTTTAISNISFRASQSVVNAPDVRANVAAGATEPGIAESQI